MLGQLKHEEIEEFLRSSVVGRIGCHAEGRTYVVPITYAYEAGAVFGRSADGLKLRMMRENPNVCFEVDRMEDLANWRSVIGWGKYEELDGSEGDHAVATLFARLLPMTVTSETSFPPKDLRHQNRVQVQGLRTIIFCIRLTEVTGRFETR